MANGITDIKAYTDLLTDNLPRILARTSANAIYLDDGLQVGQLDGDPLVAFGASLISFRPNASPQPWMYIGVNDDYKKYSVPGFPNGPGPSGVYEFDVGIAEPLTAPEAAPDVFNFYEYSGVAADWTQAGTAAAPTDVARVTDTAGDVFEDPASGTIKRCSVQVSDTSEYQTGMTLVFDAGSLGPGEISAVVEDVLPAVNPDQIINVQSIYYYNGAVTGRCVIVPTQTPSSPSLPVFKANLPGATSIYASSVVSGLRRGSILRMDNGVDPAENVLILSVTVGPDGTVSFETETTFTHNPSTSMAGIPAIVVSRLTTSYAGVTITCNAISSVLTGAGEGMLDQTLSVSPFNQLLTPSTTRTAQQDDYVGFSVNISDLSKFSIGTIIFSVDAGGQFDTNAFYAQFTTADLVTHKPAPSADTQVQESTDASAAVLPQETDVIGTTPLPVTQYTTIRIPISRFTRLGNDLTKTLANAIAVRVKFDCTDTVTILIGSFYVGGGGQGDVGNFGSPYFYAVRGRSSMTGAVSNPSPITRYGVSPRRQQVVVSMVDTVLDSQMDLWDIFRFGGTVSSWRYIGTIANTGGGTDVFTDNYPDAAALGGSAIEYDNFQPWPSIEIPFGPIAGTASGLTTQIYVYGTTILLVYSEAAPFTNPVPSIERFLPGNIVVIDGQNAYTLRSRPRAVTMAVPPAADYLAFEFDLVENAGSSTPHQIIIQEPNVANQHLPYLWGPDAVGTVFAVGDELRPGTVYYSKSYQPDSAPDRYNIEVTNPSEPLLGGQVINGLSFVASSDNWWALYPTFNNALQRYQPKQIPVGRGLVAPFAHCTDGKRIFFVAKDGIWMHSGGPAVSLTNDDLYNIFPHEGVDENISDYTYAGYTIYAPDYKRAAQFRLSFCNSYLYFDYRDSTGGARTLVCDLRNPEKPAWSVDVYRDPIAVHYGLEQPEGSLLSTGTIFPMLLMGDDNGIVYTQKAKAGDNATSIAGAIATFEFNGGDIRENQLFNDAFVDFLPISGIEVAAISGKTAVTAYRAYAASATRVQTNLPIGQELSFCGVLLRWTDVLNQNPTVIYAWQPMYQGVPVKVFAWKTQFTGFGLNGYKSLRQWNFAYRAKAEVTITITAYDGTSPAVITLPSTGDAVVKTMFPFTFNKGMLYQFTGSSTDDWAPYLSESELLVGEWSREDSYKTVHDINAPVGIKS